MELLASLTVLGLLSLMILAGLGGRSIAWNRMDRDSSGGEAVEAVQGLLRQRIGHAWPITLYNIVPPGPDFHGDTARMDFLAPPPAASAPGPLRRYQLALDAGGDLVLDSLSDVAMDQQHWSDRQVLLHGVQSLELSYFGAPLKPRTGAVAAIVAVAPTGGPSVADWQPSWNQQPVMPSLVRIRLAFLDGDRRRWPDLIVHPAANIDTSCVLVPATGGCRGR